MSAKPAAVNGLPAGKGSYLVWFRVAEPLEFDCGALGTRRLDTGWTGYAGSAFGAGGLAARLRRHLGSGGRRHWHIDYLRSHIAITEFWFSHDPQRREHLWAEVAAELPGAQRPVRGFGSSDCSCESHLVHLPARPVFSRFVGAVAAHAPEHLRISRRRRR